MGGLLISTPSLCHVLITGGPPLVSPMSINVGGLLAKDGDARHAVLDVMAPRPTGIVIHFVILLKFEALKFGGSTKYKDHKSRPSDPPSPVCLCMV